MEWEQSLIGIFHTGQKLCLMVFHIWLCNNRGLNYIAAFHKRIEIDTTMEIETYLQSFCVSQNIFSTQPWERSSLKFDINLHCNEFTINVGLRIPTGFLFILCKRRWHWNFRFAALNKSFMSDDRIYGRKRQSNIREMFNNLLKWTTLTSA